MAQYIVPPRSGVNVIIKCNGCGTLYVPDKGKHPYNDPSYFEKCPMCGYSTNSKYQIIPLWKYNLIKYWRGLFNRGDKGDQRSNPEQCERAGGSEGPGSER